ncbi:uncharacterized protein LOC131692663 [Topomyia yanbarensis]|uniref:uncharacterized protein LOC131692663 n=1 Tax=Topomyia yanbarensis TaxID=2498891 RepID=UPI00273ABA4C|nr:uncharacterized protein LOC131692663 [Topomyia yanbarensis]
MINRIVGALVLTSIVANVVIAETAVQLAESKPTIQAEARQAIVPNIPGRWWPYGWGWGWGWGIAIFVLAIVKGSILLGIFVIWAFFKSFGRKGQGCAPIIIRESPPPIFNDFNPHQHHPWDRVAGENEYPARMKRSTNYTDSQLYWTDMVTDLGFSFLGVHSKDCRKRFVCEVDVRARRDPMLSFAMRLFGRDIFQRYRSVGDKKANSFDECSKLYSKCKMGGPSITFNVMAGQTDPLLDYDDSLQEATNNETIDTVGEATTEENSLEGETTEATTTTTIATNIPRKKYAYKRRRLFTHRNSK